MSMISTYRQCQKLTDGEKVKRCWWWFFFDPKKSIKRLHPYSLFEKGFGEPNSDFRDFIEEWYQNEEDFTPLLYYFVNYVGEE